jgi:hypothetical protein
VVCGQLQASPRHQGGRTYVSQKTLLNNFLVKRVATQVEFVVMIGGVHPVINAAGFRESEILFLNMLLPAIVG